MKKSCRNLPLRGQQRRVDRPPRRDLVDVVGDQCLKKRPRVRAGDGEHAPLLEDDVAAEFRGIAHGDYNLGQRRPADKTRRRPRRRLAMISGIAYNDRPMDILLVDDSIPFDGYSPSSQPLGGIEKAFARLPAGLRRRGHDVRVINRCAFAITAEDVPWQPWESPRPARCDVLVAHRKPSLLDFPVAADRRILWLGGPGAQLDKGMNAEILARHGDAPVVFHGPAHRAGCPTALEGRAVVVEPGVRRDYREAEPMAPAHPPRAVATVHPASGPRLAARVVGQVDLPARRGRRASRLFGGARPGLARRRRARQD